MPDEGQTPTREPTRRRRGIVWALIVVASGLLVVSITANWVQRTLLDTDQVTDETAEILADEDVQEQLSIYAVDQLYATVDVQGTIEERLPPPARPFAGPVSAAARELATDLANRALASPRVQERVSTAVGTAHERFVKLIRDEGEYVSTTGGEVTFNYGSAIADLAARLGLDPGTISEVRGVIQDFSANLRERLTTAQGQIASLRSSLAQVEEGELPPDTRQQLQTVHDGIAEARATIADLEQKIGDVQGKVPSQLEGVLSKLGDRLADLDSRLKALERRTASVLEDPSEANVAALDDLLATLDTRITELLDRQVIQTPGELVLMDSTQLDAVQSLVQTLRNLGLLLPVLVLLLYVGAIYLAAGWRREALIAAGGGILAATLLVLLVRRVIGSEVTSLASSESVEPAVRSIWDILSAGLRERALFILVIGLAFVGAGALAGPSRPATAIRRFLAPFLRDHPVAVHCVVAGLFLLWLTFLPGIDNLGQVLVIVLLAALAVVGVQVLRRQTTREFPP